VRRQALAFQDGVVLLASTCRCRQLPSFGKLSETRPCDCSVRGRANLQRLPVGTPVAINGAFSAPGWPMRRHHPLLLLTWLFALDSACLGQEALPRPEDLVAGYQQNRRLFDNARIVWVRRHHHMPGWFANLSFRIKQQEELAAKADISPEARDGHLETVKSYQKAMAAEEQHNGDDLLQEFVIDRAHGRFQQRVAPADWLSVHPQPPWDFPTDRPTPEALRTVYSDFAIYSFDAAFGNMCRYWAGDRFKDNHLASIVAKPPDSPQNFFPPLACEDQSRGKQWHPFDEFFSFPVAQMSVKGRTEVDGHSTYILEAQQAATPPYSYIPHEYMAKYKDRLRMIPSVTAWVDVSRGCIPLRIEWDGILTLDGRRFRPQSQPNRALSEVTQPSRALSEVKVERVEGGGYYPVKGVTRGWAADAAAMTDYDFEKVITGQSAVTNQVLSEETSWQVGSVRVNCVTPDDLTLAFPEKTLYSDEAQANTFVTGEAQSLLDDVIGPEGKSAVLPAAPAANQYSPAWWLVGGNIVFLVLLGCWFFFRGRTVRRTVP
jgi:hypothetical protein